MKERNMGYKVAVAGATGNVGREMLEILAERDFPADDVIALASSRSVGREVSFGDDDILSVQDLEHYDFSDTDIALFSPGSKASAKHAPRAAKAGCVVIDNSSYFRMDPDVPLVVPEVNLEDSIGTPSATSLQPQLSTIQMVVARSHTIKRRSSACRYRPISRLRRRQGGNGRTV